MSGELQALRFPPVEQTKVDPASLVVNLKVGVGLFITDPLAGPPVIVAVGLVVSAVKLVNAA